MTHQDRSARAILLLWAPLALQWLMMALEGPFLAAVVARLVDPTWNLAAYGVAFSLAILVESPVIMLMSASTALVEDADSYRRLRNFAHALNAGSTALLLFVLVPPLYDLLIGGLLGLPERVADLVYGALWLLLPWPAAIGYRRFLHGLLIRAGKTRRIAVGTGIRLVAMAAAALALAQFDLHGAWVGAAALSAGVVAEAIVSGFMAAGTVRRLLHTAPVPGPPLDYTGIGRFYLPLALTSFISLAVHPLLTFFMGRAPAPVESLALFPVVHGLTFIFRALGLSYQEVAIALLGRRSEHARPVAGFAGMLALATSGALALVAFTPLADVWYITISGLPPRLAELAVTPTRVLATLPALTVFFAFQCAVLVQQRTTRPITVATVVEVGGIAALFPVLAWGFGMMGVTAAMLAFLGGRLAAVLLLVPRTAPVLTRVPPPAEEAAM